MIESGADQQILLRWHLVTNHYPPVSPDWILCCAWVIQRAIDGEDLEVPAPVPEGYRPQLASNVFRELHLEPFTHSELED
jgi:hypothetical protein